MTEPRIQYLAALFQSVSHVISAEHILKEAQVPHKIIPVPRKISSDCGVAGKDFDYLKKYGMISKGTMIINGKTKYDNLNKEIIEKAIDKAVHEDHAD